VLKQNGGFCSGCIKKSDFVLRSLCFIGKPILFTKIIKEEELLLLSTFIIEQA
jgi:hypothetical protein